MGDLVEGGGGLVLSVAGAGGGGQSAEVQRAVDDVAARWEGVGQDVAGAGAVDVTAVSAGGAAGGAAALADDFGEDAGDSGADRGRLEVLVHLGGVGQGSRRGSGREGTAGGDRIAGGGKLSTGAVGLDGLLGVYLSATTSSEEGSIDSATKGIENGTGNGTQRTVRLFKKAVRTWAASAPST